MSDAVITALIVSFTSIVCQILINKGNRTKQMKADIEKEKERAAEQARKDEHLENRLTTIERKLDAHNGYADKITAIATDIAVIKNDIKTLYNLAS